ncbi:hypothetical protein MIND_00168000 [Mycena indigotica]|uniref:F-box domain-containing protein n=1 Tax=Mycena indigotica TaxID=2126181 RepID=A0A8H6TFV0_9AGAR|nr:uncharacterized protein MIND_00168000 [Mycena indigotica]KAF7316489.1 hypothetical protein MIND_00168000 [Mycena indigotica]
MLWFDAKVGLGLRRIDLKFQWAHWHISTNGLAAPLYQDPVNGPTPQYNNLPSSSTTQLEGIPTMKTFLDLPQDILLHTLTMFCNDWDRARISKVSRQLRTLVKPAIFRRVTWSPHYHPERGFVPEELFSYIRRLIVDDKYGRTPPADIASELRKNLARFPVLDLLAFKSVDMSDELMEALRTAPALTKITLVMPQPGRSILPPRLAPNLSAPALKKVVLRTSLRVANYNYGLTRRERKHVELEAGNFSCVFAAAHTTLETLIMLGEHLFIAFDPTLDWGNLRELHVQGFWPILPEGSQQAKMRDILEALPLLAVLKLNLTVPKDESEASTCAISEDHLPRNPATFLSRLRHFELASLSPSERILSFLPEDIQTLTLTRFPLQAAALNTRQSILTTDVLHQFLKPLQFPRLTSLTVWYHIDSPAALEDEDALLSDLASKFPLLQHLEIHRRWSHYNELLEDRWDPVRPLRELLSKLPRLERCSIDVDHPDRYGQRAFHAGVDRWGSDQRECEDHEKRLRLLAMDIVASCPPLRHLSMYREMSYSAITYWAAWFVIWAADGSFTLAPESDRYTDWLDNSTDMCYSYTDV